VTILSGKLLAVPHQTAAISCDVTGCEPITLFEIEFREDVFKN